MCRICRTRRICRPPATCRSAAGARAWERDRAAASIPWWNTFSLMIFLCWFGAAGYLLTRYGSFVAGVVVVLAGVCGVAGGAIVFFFLAKVLLPHEHELTADETDVVGVVGRVSAPIRAGGIGEIVYEQLGARRSAPARSEDGVAIQKAGRGLRRPLRKRNCLRPALGRFAGRTGTQGLRD